MEKIEVTKPFKFVDIWEVHPREYGEGEWTVKDGPDYVKRECSPVCAEVALSEGWGKEVGKATANPTGSQDGKAKQSPSARPARRSRGRKSTR